MDDDTHPVSSCDPMLSSPAPSSTLSSSSPTSIYSNDDTLSPDSIDLLWQTPERTGGFKTASNPLNKTLKRQISENVQKLLSADFYMLSQENSFSRQESRDSLIEVALDNTEQIVSKLLGKNSRNVLNSRQTAQELWS